MSIKVSRLKLFVGMVMVGLLLLEWDCLGMEVFRMLVKFVRRGLVFTVREVGADELGRLGGLKVRVIGV